MVWHGCVVMLAVVRCQWLVGRFHADLSSAYCFLLPQQPACARGAHRGGGGRRRGGVQRVARGDGGHGRPHQGARESLQVDVSGAGHPCWFACKLQGLHRRLDATRSAVVQACSCRRLCMRAFRMSQCSLLVSHVHILHAAHLRRKRLHWPPCPAHLVALSAIYRHLLCTLLCEHHPETSSRPDAAALMWTADGAEGAARPPVPHQSRQELGLHHQPGAPASALWHDISAALALFAQGYRVLAGGALSCT